MPLIVRLNPRRCMSALLVSLAASVCVMLMHIAAIMLLQPKIRCRPSRQFTHHLPSPCSRKTTGLALFSGPRSAIIERRTDRPTFYPRANGTFLNASLASYGQGDHDLLFIFTLIIGSRRRDLSSDIQNKLHIHLSIYLVLEDGMALIAIPCMCNNAM